MGLQSAQLFGMLHERIDWLAQRQRVLSQNVSNADTPDYKARDLKPLDFRKTLQGRVEKLALVRTNAEHLFEKDGADTYGVRKSRVPYEVSISGNSVVLEQQMAKVAANQADYQLATRIFTKYKKMHAVALGERS